MNGVEGIILDFVDTPFLERDFNSANLADLRLKWLILEENPKNKSPGRKH